MNPPNGSELDQLLDENLQEASFMQPPGNFAQIITQKIKRKVYGRSNRRFYLWTLVLFMTGTALTYGILILVSKADAERMVHIMWENRIIVMLMVVLFILMQWIDNRIVMREDRVGEG